MDEILAAPIVAESGHRGQAMQRAGQQEQGMHDYWLATETHGSRPAQFPKIAHNSPREWRSAPGRPMALTNAKISLSVRLISSLVAAARAGRRHIASSRRTIASGLFFFFSM